MPQKRPVPDYSDYVIDHDYNVWYEHKPLAIIPEDPLDRDSILAAIQVNMCLEHYWPNVYFINDHGNMDLLSVDTGEIVQSWV